MILPSGLQYTLKRVGPKTDPCGTPYLTSVVAVELVPQRVNRWRSFSTLMLTLGDIVLVRLASNIIRYGCNGNILLFRKSPLIRYNLFNYYYAQ